MHIWDIYYFRINYGKLATYVIESSAIYLLYYNTVVPIHIAEIYFLVSQEIFKQGTCGLLS